MKIMRIMRIIKALYIYSPQRNLRQIMKKIYLNKNEVQKKPDHRNDAIDDIINCKSLPELLAFKINRLNKGSYTLLGDKTQIDSWGLNDKCPGYNIRSMNWDWPSEINFRQLKLERIIFCRVPKNSQEWQKLSNIRLYLKNDLYTIVELLLPYTRITFLQKKLDYFIKTFDEILPYYMGTDFFGPLEDLDNEYNLQGKKVIEFGPFDGCQSAGLT